MFTLLYRQGFLRLYLYYFRAFQKRNFLEYKSAKLTNCSNECLGGTGEQLVNLAL